MKKVFPFIFSLLIVSLVGFSVDHHRWPIKTKPAHRTRPAKVELHDLISMPDPPDVSMNDSRYEEDLIPSFSNPLHLEEGQLVRTEGYMWLVAHETNDDEFHIQISGSKSSGDNCFIVEVPDPANVDDPSLKTKYEKIRTFIREKILHGNEPGTTGNEIGGRAYVYVKGQLFYDASHTHNQTRGKKGMHSSSLWEIHPIIDMNFAVKPGG